MAILEAIVEGLLAVMEGVGHAKSKWGNAVFWCACAALILLLLVLGMLWFL